MKNKKIIFSSLITLLSISTFVGCNDESNSSVTSSSQISSSVSEELLTQRAEIKNMLKNLSNGFTLEGEIKEKRSFLDAYHGNPTGDISNINYDGQFVYEIGETKAYSAFVNMQEGENPKEVLINNVIYEDENGYANYESLNYDNTIDKYPFYDENYQNVNFNYYCLNPFDYLLPEDFTKTGDNTYSLNYAKSSFVSSYLFIDVSSAFQNVIEKCEFKVENNQFKSLTIVPSKYYSSVYDKDNHSSIYYYANFEASFEIKNIGTAKVAGMTPKEATAETEALQNAFNKFANKNYTVKLHGKYVDQNGEFIDENYEYTYYDGEAAYCSYIEDQSAHDEVNNMYCEPNSEGILSHVGVTYDEFVPKMSEIDAAIFSYNSETGLYSICSEMVSYIGTVAIVPKVTNFYIEVDGYTTACDIKLDSDGNIEYINIKYEKYFTYSAEFGDIMLTFYDIDNTKIPHGLKKYE